MSKQMTDFGCFEKKTMQTNKIIDTPKIANNKTPQKAIFPTCAVCKLPRTSEIVVFSTLKNEQKFVKLICPECVKETEKVVEVLPKDNALEKKKDSLKGISLEQVKVKSDPPKDQSKESKWRWFKTIKQFMKDVLEITLYIYQLSQSAFDYLYNSKLVKILKEIFRKRTFITIKQQPAFSILDHHSQIQLDKFLIQFKDSSQKIAKDLLEKKVELKKLESIALKPIFEIQNQIDLIGEDISQITHKTDELVNKLQVCENQEEKQKILEGMRSLVEVQPKGFNVQFNQENLDQEMFELSNTLEFLRYQLDPMTLSINSQIFGIKKRTLESCNRMLLRMNIQKYWNHYSDIKMQLEVMHIGMRGVYRYSIDKNGTHSLGTNTGYVYLAMTTTQEYEEYQFQGLVSLNKEVTNYWGGNSSKSPIAGKLCQLFKESLVQISELESEMNKYVDKK